jgi:hypothetical protein
LTVTLFNCADFNICLRLCPAGEKSLRTARVVATACAVVVLGLTAVGALYVAHKPSKWQRFWSFYRHEPTLAEISAATMTFKKYFPNEPIPDSTFEPPEPIE